VCRPDRRRDRRAEAGFGPLTPGLRQSLRPAAILR
jgi:hypothetical protein